MGTNPTFGAIRSPIVDKDGLVTKQFRRQLDTWRKQLANISPTFTGLSAVTPLNGIAAGAGPQGAEPIIANTITRFTTVDSSNQSTTLTPSVAGMQATIINAGANPLSIYPGVGDQIDALGINQPLVLAAGKSAQLTCAIEGEWNSIVGA